MARRPPFRSLPLAILILTWGSPASGPLAGDPPPPTTGGEVDAPSAESAMTGVEAEPPLEAETPVRIEVQVRDKRGRSLAKPSMTSVLGHEASVTEGIRVPLEGPNGESTFAECKLSLSLLPRDTPSERVALSVRTEWSGCWPHRRGRDIRWPMDTRVTTITWSGELDRGEWATVAARRGVHVDVAISDPEPTKPAPKR